MQAARRQRMQDQADEETEQNRSENAHCFFLYQLNFLPDRNCASTPAHTSL